MGLMVRFGGTLLVVTLLVSSAGLSAVARAGSGFEEPPVLKAKELVPSTMLKGPRFGG